MTDATFEMAQDVPVGRIAGDIDAANTDAIEQRIVENVSNDVFGFVLDLSGVTYLDSAGIRLLFQLESRLEGRQVKLVICVPEGAQINRTLDAVGAEDSLCLRRTLDESIAEIERTKQPPTG